VVGSISVVAVLDVTVGASVMGAAVEVAAGLLLLLVLSVAALAMRCGPSFTNLNSQGSIMLEHIVIGTEAHVQAC